MGILRSERFPNDIYPRLQLMIKDVNSLINHADFSFQRLDYIQDAALGLINIEQNEIVKIFSVAAVIFMPATLIASIYGMNFKFMPELDWTKSGCNATGRIDVLQLTALPRHAERPPCAARVLRLFATRHAVPYAESPHPADLRIYPALVGGGIFGVRPERCLRNRCDRFPGGFMR